MNDPHQPFDPQPEPNPYRAPDPVDSPAESYADPQSVPDDPQLADVIEHLEALHANQRSILKNLVILVVSLVAFALLGFFDNPLVDLVLLIGVLLFHETGHYVAMRMLGYEDVQMFFIPFFGAAVKGHNPTAPGWKRAIVVLMGPAPGLLVGVALGLVYAVTDDSLMRSAALMLCVINGFNLLPFFPLDGGRLLNDILFCRWPWTELAVLIFGGVGLILISWMLGAWLLMALGAMILFASRHTFRVARMAQQFREPVTATPARTAAELPAAIVYDMMLAIREKIPTVVEPKLIGTTISQVYEKAIQRPPGPLTTVFFLGVYAFLVFFPLAAAIVAMAIQQAR